MRDWGLLLSLALVATANGRSISGPSSFYIVSVFFSDNGALFYYRVIDVKPDGPDTIVRYVRVAPADVFCSKTKIVEAAQARVRNTSPAELVGKNDPCAIDPGQLAPVVKKYHRTSGIFEAISFGVVAQCGTNSVALGLPDDQQINTDRLKHSHPEMAALWHLSSDVIDGPFGNNDIFHDRSEKEAYSLQRAGEGIVAELRSGRYDAGLAAASKGNVGNWKSPSFRSLLEDYHGPIQRSEVQAWLTPRLLDADRFQFASFSAPNYPPLAKQARIEGKVELELAVDPTSGDVLSASSLSGHPLLVTNSIDSAKRWRFSPGSVASGKAQLIIEYSLRCP
jgi:hypothetical protein